jgi:hypothetical protein
VGTVHATALCNRTTLNQVDGAWYVKEVGAIPDNLNEIYHDFM